MGIFVGLIRKKVKLIKTLRKKIRQPKLPYGLDIIKGINCSQVNEDKFFRKSDDF